MSNYSFILSGGGTGGHIYPAVSIADALKEKYPDAKFLFVGASDRMEMQKIPACGYSIEGLWISGIQRKLSLKNLLLPLKLISSLIKSYLILKKQRPNIAIGTGGYASAALLKMAGWMGIPTLIQEQNSYPGITNKWLADNATKICVAYPNLERYFPKEKIVYTGNPIRKAISNAVISPTEAKKHFGLNPDKNTLLVIGGSLGAKAINELIADKIDFFDSKKMQVLWQCGKLYYERFKHLASSTIHITAYINQMDMAYGAASIIISRAGASSVSELSLIGKPVIFIPSPYVSEDHQTKNAEAVVNQSAAVLIPQNELESSFEHQFSSLLKNEMLQRELSKNIKALAKPEATKNIVAEIEKIINT